MEEIIVGWFGKYSLFAIPVLSGIICSFIIEGINKATPDSFNGKLITTVVAIVFGVFLIFGFPSVVTGWFDMVIIAVLNIAFALLFYHLGGKKIVEAIVGNAVERVTKKIKE